MANPHGTPIWYDYAADDVDAAERFYTEVMGWTARPFAGGGVGDYRVLSAPDGEGVAGLMPRPADAPFPAGWLLYIGVDDVDATLARALAAGARALMPATTIDLVGRMALIADPEGQPLYLMRGASSAESTSFRGSEQASPGHMVWNERSAQDQDAVLAFFGPLFGWRHEGELPMGALGAYRFVFRDTACLGATMTAPAGTPPGWRFYTLVDSIDAAADRLRAAGGRVVYGPDPIPGGAYSLIATDPAGAFFGLVGPRGAAS